MLALRAGGRFVCSLVAEVELGQPAGAVLVAVGDLVEVVLERRREVVVDEVLEVRLHQPDDSERDPRRHQRAALFHDVAAVLDGPDDRRVGRRSADPELFEHLDQRRLGVARGRVGGVPVGLEVGRGEVLSLGQLRQARLGVVGLTTGLLVDGLDVCREETGERDGPARRREGAALTVAAWTARRSGDTKAQRGSARVGHLRCDGPLPDQLVEAELVGLELAGHLPRGSECLTRGTDRLVRLLRILDLAVVLPRRCVYELGAVKVSGLGTRSVDRRLTQRRRVGTHVGDVAVLVQPLCDAHRAIGGEAQLATGLLLQRRGHERCIRLARVGLLLHRRDRHVGAVEGRGQRGRPLAIEHDDTVRALQVASRIEVAACRDPRVVDGHQPRREGARRRRLTGVERRVDVPVLRRHESHALPLAFDDDARRDRLHAARRQLRHDLLPQHG